MEELQLLNAIERYLRNEMNQEEKTWFEELRRSNPEVDQLVVENSIFLNQVNKFGDMKNYKSTLQDVHNKLLESGTIKQKPARGVVKQLWPRYRRNMAVAASVAGVTALLIAGMGWYSQKARTAELEQLNRKFEYTKRTIDQLKQKVENNDRQVVPKLPDNVILKSGGTAFLIDGKGYLVTNAHVIKAPNIVVQNNKSQIFRTTLIHVNPVIDIAILKIEDNDFKSFGLLPYGIRQSGADLGETLFTLGYPREDEIVYNEGYMSAKTGFNGDTMTCQIGVSANPGNSGGPVFNKNGEVIGIINTRQTHAQGVVFALTAKNIFRTLDEISKTDTAIKKLKLPTASSIKGVDRVQQIKKIEDCVFMVKSY